MADEKTINDPITDDAAVVESRDDSPHPHDDRPSDDLQRGVKEVEAAALAWTKPTLIAVFLKSVLVLPIVQFEYGS